MYRIHKGQVKDLHRDDQLKNAIKVSQRNPETFFGFVKKYHKEASEIILKTIYGEPSKKEQRYSIMETFEDLIRLNNKRKIFDIEIIKEKQNYFLDLFDSISK